MKLYCYLLTLLIAFAACKKNETPHKRDYDKSYNAWLNFKAASGDSYQYKVATSSWTGASSETVITVRNGRPVKRSYVAKDIDPVTRQVIVREEWTEEENTLKLHENGASPTTLDKIYQQAREEWLLKRRDTQTYFETDNKGMISKCGYVPNGCVDDCFNGIRIALIEKI